MSQVMMMIAFLISGAYLNAQEDPVRTIVLINGNAHLVDVAVNGDLVAIYQRVEGLFTSGESTTSIIDRLSKDQPAPSGQIVFFEKEEEPIPSFSEENKQPIITGSSQYIGFSPERALLLNTAVDQIRKIADQFEVGVVQSITVISYHLDNYRSRSLARNRAKAIKDLLMAFGVNGLNISTLTSAVSPDSKLDFVQVKF